MCADVERGHGTLPHTADLIIEAWGGDEAACAEEAACALIEICVTGEPDPVSGFTIKNIHARRSRDLIEAVLDEVLFELDTSDLVPVAAQLEPLADSGFELRLAQAPRDAVAQTGAAPKAIVMLALEPNERDRTVRCRFIVDV